MATVEAPPAAAKADHVADLVARYFGLINHELQISGLRVSDLAACHGTPLFIYDQSVLRERLQALRNALPERFDVYYSVKANPNQAILRYFVAHDCGLEIASSGELQQVLAAGCAADRIVFAGPGKTEPELAAALDAVIREIHVESPREARCLARLAAERRRPARIAIRINPADDVEGGGMRMGGRPTPFGIDEDQLEPLLQYIEREPWLHLVGIHVYVGTQILDSELLLAQYRAALAIARRVAKVITRPLETIDFGGGLGIPYFAQERELDLQRLKSGLQELVEETAGDSSLSKARFILEPGRFLVASAGLYVVRAVDVKTSRGKKFIITDGGMHHHLAASGNLGQTIKRNFPVAVLNKLGHPAAEPVDVVGPLCTPLDVLARAIELPVVEVGDFIGIFQSGAYARAASPLGFLSRQSPPEVLVGDGRDQLIRRRGRDDDWFSDQVNDAARALSRPDG